MKKLKPISFRLYLCRLNGEWPRHYLSSALGGLEAWATWRNLMDKYYWQCLIDRECPQAVAWRWLN